MKYSLRSLMKFSIRDIMSATVIVALAVALLYLGFRRSPFTSAVK